MAIFPELSPGVELEVGAITVSPIEMVVDAVKIATVLEPCIAIGGGDRYG